MTSKKIIAFMLTLCMLLTVMPVFAANITVNDVEFPEQGLSAIVTRTIWEAITVGEKANNVLIILNDDTSKLFPLRSAKDHYAGVELSFTVACNNEVLPEGMPDTFTVKDAVAYYTRTDGGGRMCFGVEVNELIAASPELSAVADANFGYTMQESPFTITDFFVKQGSWEAETLNTGIFSKDTLFLSYMGFNKYPSTWPNGDTYAGYSNLMCRNIMSNSGPYQFFVPEATGEYNVYVQLVSNSGSLSDRMVDISFNGNVLKFEPELVEASKLPSAMAPVWVAATDNKTVTLTKDELVAVQLVGTKIYGRPIAIALVPVADNAAVSESLLASPQTININFATLSALAETEYHPAFSAEAVNVTVNNKPVEITAGYAAKSITSGNGYIVNASNGPRRCVGVAVRILPETNTFATYTTAIDAIAKYIRENQTSATDIADLGTFNNGKFGSVAVLVNGVVKTDLDWCEIKDGDVITLVDKNSKFAFDPVSIKGFYNVETGGLIQAIGTPTDSGAVIPGGKFKFCLNMANATSALGSFATNLDEKGLKDCYLVGYATMRKTEAGSFTNLDPDGKVYFENVPILDYNKNTNGTLNQGGSRIDLVTGGKPFYSANDPLFKDANNNTVTNEDGAFLVKPYGYYPDQFLYNWKNVYFVNSSTDVSLKATKGEGKYTLTTGGMHVVDVVIATYAEDGKTITGTELLKEQIVMFNAPLEITVGANQKAFVWKTNVYEGTTMVPAVPTLLGANF